MHRPPARAVALRSAIWAAACGTALANALLEVRVLTLAAAELRNDGAKARCDRNSPSPTRFAITSPRNSSRFFAIALCFAALSRQSPTSRLDVIAKYLCTSQSAQLQSSVRVDPAQKFAIEKSSLERHSGFYCEILLAALLIMCNAAENFLPLKWKSCG